MVDVARWSAAIPVRRARRSFTSKRPSDAALDALEACAEGFRPFGEVARATVIRQASQSLFMGIAGSYGGISGAPSALAFVGCSEGAHVRAAVGYTGEGLILEATALGLDTCWVGGMFSSRHAGLAGGVTETERVYAVSPVGHAAAAITAKERVVFGMGRVKFRRELSEIAPGFEAWPLWARAGLDAVRIAPSAMNRQPWRFRLTDDGIVLSAAAGDTPRVSKQLDCGIAMLHFELGARAHGAHGEWAFLDGPDVAIWKSAS